MFQHLNVIVLWLPIILAIVGTSCYTIYRLQKISSLISQITIEYLVQSVTHIKILW